MIAEVPLALTPFVRIVVFVLLSSTLDGPKYAFLLLFFDLRLFILQYLLARLFMWNSLNCVYHLLQV